MNAELRLCLVLHDHQPVGNFEQVFEQSYGESYLPFLETFEPYSDLAISLHTSGPLLEWLEARHPEYVERLARLVAAGRVEIVGGAFYEPILTMIPSRDRIGQIVGFSRHLHERFGATPRGLWLPERVWEQSLVSDLARADIAYTILDDCHFRSAGLVDHQLTGHFVTEDDGRTLGLFPGSERLRYLIPFRSVDETIDHLREQAQRAPGSVAVFADDGEKFGTWPETYRHVHQEGWLRRFFDALVRERSWLRTVTLATAHAETSPVGRIYVPDGSYREMTEWALPVERQQVLDDLKHRFEHDERWDDLRSFVRGGNWRNFKVRYPESNEMYARMMHVSARLAQAEQEGLNPRLLADARRELYRGQCNCSYWHGAFGGIYLPHLRHAVHSHLILADTLLERAERSEPTWVEATADDYDFDTAPEVRLANDRLVAWIDPSVGGRLYALDVRALPLDLGATLARRPEAYHAKVRHGSSGSGGEVASIHDRVVFKQPGLDRMLQYDRDLRKSLIDRFLDADLDPGAIERNETTDHGDFADAPYAAKVRRSPQRIQVQLRRVGTAWDLPVTITKGVTLEAGSSALEIAYLLEGLPRDRSFRFAIEFHFAGLPAGADDRFFHRLDGQRLGQLETRLDLEYVTDLCLTDSWQGLDLRWTANRPTGLLTWPIASVSQSEGGFEGVHQSVALLPHWMVRGDAAGRWSVTMRLEADTTLAESRRPFAPFAQTVPQ